MIQGLKKVFTSVKQFAVKSKDKAMAALGIGAATLLAGPSDAAAAVTYDPVTFSFSGAIESAPFTSAVVVLLALIGLKVAVMAGLNAFKRGA